MHVGVLHRAAVSAAVAVIVVAGVATADTVSGDADVVAAGIQGSRDLGEVAPGATLTADVGFELRCAGTGHLDPGQSVGLAFVGAIVPEDGSLHATATSIGPVPAGWPPDGGGGTACPWPAPRLASTTPSTVSLTAPSLPGGPYEFVLVYEASVGPAGVDDAGSLDGGPVLVSLVVRVADVASDTTAPVFDAPLDDVLVETADPAGAAVAYRLPTATDGSDPAVAVACDPPPGSWFPPGITTVECIATDDAGNAATADLRVTVVRLRAAFDPPAAGNGPLAVRAGRTVPVAVRLWRDGAELTSGTPGLVVAPCAGGPPSIEEIALRWKDGAGRWSAHLDTSGLARGCHRVAALAGGSTLGSFLVDVRP